MALTLRRGRPRALPHAHRAGFVAELPTSVPARTMAVSSWPMWVLGFAAMIDNVDQYIVRGAANHIESAFRVDDLAIGVLFSAFILVNGVVTMPAGYLADRWNRTRTMAVTIAAWSLISALGGLVPTGAFALLVVMRGALGFGQAITDPSGSSLVADFYTLERRGKAFSVQQCLVYLGLGLGLVVGAAFATHFGHLGWRLAFGVSIVPGLLIAWWCRRLPEPTRGGADQAYARADTQIEVAEHHREPLLPEGVGRFLVDVVRGLRADVRTILDIATMRYALVGVSAILFVVTAVATWMPTFYERQLHLHEGAANAAFGLLVVGAGIPGTIIGGRIADRWVHRFLGARMVIPGVCLAASSSLFIVSFLPLPFGVVYGVQLVAFFAATCSVPALRAGLSDTVPAHLRGTGFGAFNLASVVFGAAAAPVITSSLANAFGGDYRTAFLVVMPFALLGALFLLAARRHIAEDTAKLFQAVVAAMAAEQSRS